MKSEANDTSTSASEAISVSIDRLIKLFIESGNDNDFQDIILLNLYRLTHEKGHRLTEKQNAEIGRTLEKFRGTQKPYLFKSDWDGNKYRHLLFERL
jgi:hypothetical protein